MCCVHRGRGGNASSISFQPVVKAGTDCKVLGFNFVLVVLGFNFESKGT